MFSSSVQIPDHLSINLMQRQWQKLISKYSFTFYSHREHIVIIALHTLSWAVCLTNSALPFLSQQRTRTIWDAAFPASATTKRVVIILDFPVIAKCPPTFSTSAVALAVFSEWEWGRYRGRKNIFSFYEVKRIQMGRISQFDLFSITEPGYIRKKTLNNWNLWRQ